ncbi:MAG: SLC13 family permease [Lachnospiraceae bacterium]|jgi:Na+/H+ antiporter NhaD/arsenite permease-like protein
MKLAALIIFVTMYVLMIIFMKHMRVRTGIVLAAAVIFIATGILPLRDIAGSINWNVLLMMAGTMILVDYFIDSKMPNRMADIILDKCKNVCSVIIAMSIFAGVISAFIDNVATVVMVAPVGLAICKKLKINPTGMILSIAVSSNLQGAATLVGDTTSIMLGAYAGMDFTSFFWMNGRPGIFFAVELGALATVPIMMFLFRKEKDPVEATEKTEVKDYFPTFMLVGLVAALIAVSFVPNKPDITNGVICCLFAVVTGIYEVIRTGSTEKMLHAIASVDVETLLMLFGLFLVIGGVTSVGLIDDAADLIAQLGGNNLFLLYTIIVWGSVLISAFVDNIPYVATMLPVIESITGTLGIEPYLLYFGLLSGATLGGNLTPFGASANIAASGILSKEGYTPSFKDFARIGIPFTLTAVLVGYIFIWAVWH